jgi:peptidoglycan hydrolase CwlO-like protein
VHQLAIEEESMKKIAIMLAAAFFMAATVPAYAAEMTKEEKDQCLLASKSCATEVDSIQKKIKKLNAEIKKGKKVYSAEELKKLQAKLKEAEDLVDTMLKGGGN